jgi:hypothetical protein
LHASQFDFLGPGGHLATARPPIPAVPAVGHLRAYQDFSVCQVDPHRW